MENEKNTASTPVVGVKNKSIETYAEDMAKVMEDSGSGLIKNIIHEQEMYENEKKNLSPQSGKNRFFLFVSIILLFIAFIILFLLGVFKQNNTVNVAFQATPIIFTDQNYFQDVTNLNKDEITQSVFNEVNNTNVKAGGVEAIFLMENKKTIGFSRFMSLIGANISSNFSNFINDSMLIGVFHSSVSKVVSQVVSPVLTPESTVISVLPITTEVKKDIIIPATLPSVSLFILLKVTSFTDIFPVMRDWESKMFSDMHGFFGTNISNDTKELLTKNFVDGIVDNKNARILYDKDGNIVLMYVFTNDNSVIITNSEASVTEVVSRLESSQISK